MIMGPPLSITVCRLIRSVIERSMLTLKRLAVPQRGDARTVTKDHGFEQAISDREAEHSYDEDVRALENRNLLTIGYLSARAALERRESRGAHARTDFPDTDAEAVSRRYVLASATAAASTTDRTLPIPVFSSTTHTEASYAQSSYAQSTQRHDRPGRVQGAENEGNGKTC